MNAAVQTFTPLCPTFPRRATLLPRWFELESAPITALLRALMTHLVRDQDDDSTTPGQGELVDAAQASLAAAGVDLTTAFAPDADFWRAHTQAASPACWPMRNRRKASPSPTGTSASTDSPPPTPKPSSGC